MTPRVKVRKYSNMAIVKNAAPRILALIQEPAKDYRALSVALSSAPLDGKIAENKMARDRQDRTRKAGREREHLPYFDDICW